MKKIAILGNGSWATALVKMLACHIKEQQLCWWIRPASNIDKMYAEKRNPDYLPQVSMPYMQDIHLLAHVEEAIDYAEVILLVIPSKYVASTLASLPQDSFKNKVVISAVKGIVPDTQELIHEYLVRKFNLSLSQFVTLMGPCHAEEAVEERLSFLTFSSQNIALANEVSCYFDTPFTKNVTQIDIIGVQYASLLKNIYAVGGGIIDGMGLGKNLFSVYVTTLSKEMFLFLSRLQPAFSFQDFMTSVYVGDLLVTCYSEHSRNVQFGISIGKGILPEQMVNNMNMVAEGYTSAKAFYIKHKKDICDMPIALAIYQILWEQKNMKETMEELFNQWK